MTFENNYIDEKCVQKFPKKKNMNCDYTKYKINICLKCFYFFATKLVKKKIITKIYVLCILS